MKKILFTLTFLILWGSLSAGVSQPFQLFENNSEGYFLYRIPSIVALPQNHVVAFTEARGESPTDCAENDLVCKISEDGGTTWSPMIIIATAGLASLNNPTTLYLSDINRILMMYQSYPPASYEATVAKGVESEKTCRVWTVYSDDGGYSWSTSVDVTAQTKTAKMSAVASGPGAMINLSSGDFTGRIVVPFASTGMDAGWFNYLVYSDDNGLNWKISDTFSGYGTNESQIIQISDDQLLLTVRNHRYKKKKNEKKPIGWNPWFVSRTAEDRGEYLITLTENGFNWSDLIWRKDLPDPKCQAALVSLNLLSDGRVPFIFSNPANRRIDKKINKHPLRINGTVRLSLDSGKNWGWSKNIFGDENTPFSYSVLAQLSDNRIIILFENDKGMAVRLFDLDWLSDGEIGY